jgi:hypothetical protein
MTKLKKVNSMNRDNRLKTRENEKSSHIGQGFTLGIVRGPLYGHLGVKADVFMPHVRKMGAHLIRVFFTWDIIK